MTLELLFLNFELIGLITVVLIVLLIILSFVGFFIWYWYYSRINYELNQSTVLICGANTYDKKSNLGMELAVQAAMERGATTLILIDCLPIQLENKLENLKNKVKILTYVCDVSNFDEVERVYSLITNKGEIKHVDFIFNCAGIVSGKTFDQLTPEVFKKTLHVNVLGNYNVLYCFSKLIKNDGVIVGVSSFMGLMGLFVCFF